MAIDFRAIEDIAKRSVEDFDHRYLNDLEPFQHHSPTAERLAKVICLKAVEELAATAPHATVEQIELWEVPEYRVTYRP